MTYSRPEVDNAEKLLIKEQHILSLDGLVANLLIELSVTERTEVA